LLATQHLDSQLYRNAYELMTFYDNQDMARMQADDDGFIDANNWLFTARGIPVVYYGSEIGFQAGAREHEGNRNYFGVENIERAKRHRIREALASVANIRKTSIALQRGLQVNLEFTRDTAAFYRVYAYKDTAQTALVVLNKGDTAAAIGLDGWSGNSHWRDAETNAQLPTADDGDLLDVAAHGVRVFLTDEIPVVAGLTERLNELQERARRKTAL
jgi:cyclomaltodextrin glucanotransferase